jgi:hypothetical protein
MEAKICRATCPPIALSKLEQVFIIFGNTNLSRRVEIRVFSDL